jgi:lipopolysaccharide transport system ATP-binding protein
VLASHDLDLIRLYCNKVMRMDAGVASEVVDVRKMDQLLSAA